MMSYRCMTDDAKPKHSRLDSDAQAQTHPLPAKFLYSSTYGKVAIIPYATQSIVNANEVRPNAFNTYNFDF